MGNVLSGKPKLTITDADRAVLTLKTQRRRLEDQRKRALVQIEREEGVARQLVAAGRKDRALLALKKRRLQQTQVEKLDAWLLNVESMLADVEAVSSQASMLAALKQGTDALKGMQKQVALEDVEKLLQDTADAHDYQQQLQQLLGESWTGQDETAAEAALAALETEVSAEVGAEVAAELPTVPRQPVLAAREEKELPSVPTQQPARHAPGDREEAMIAA